MKLPALFSAAALVLAGCSRHDAPAPSLPTPPTAQVKVVRVERTDLPTPIALTGTVRPVARATLAAKVMGVIEEMPVVLGQRVRTGDVLVRIAAGEIAARVAQAQSQLNQAQRDLARERALLARNASTADVVRGLEDRVTLHHAMVREAEVMLGYVTVRAPFDGVVARKPANAGDLAAPGQPLLELEGLDDFQIEAGIPDTAAARLRSDAAVRVEVPAAGATFTARLVELSSASDAGARTVLARFSVPPATPVRSGQFARLQIDGPARPALLVPAAAVSVSGQMERVFIVGPDHQAVLRLVRTGATHGGQIEILSGLSAGDTVIVAPPAGLREGQPLEVTP